MPIDQFRGLVIACMLLVNSIRGRDFAPSTFRHSDWRVGPLTATFADMVIPWFLLAVGLSLPFSMHSGRGSGMTFRRKFVQALRRSALLFIIGGLIEAARVAYHEPISWRSFISLDVLPQIAVACLAAIVLYHGPAWGRPAFIAAVFISKWILLAHWPYPGVGHALWTPEQNMQDYLRSRFPLFKGLHGAMVAACIVVIGTYLGDLLRTRAGRATVLMLGLGAGLIALSLLWSFDLPLSRYYHTPTWALMGAGTGCLMLAGLAWASPKPWGSWLTFFEPWGRNAITVYIAAELLWPMVLLEWRVRAPSGDAVTLWEGLELALGSVVGTAAAPWVQVAMYLAAFWWFAFALFRKRVFLKL